MPLEARCKLARALEKLIAAIKLGEQAYLVWPRPENPGEIFCYESRCHLLFASISPERGNCGG
jgi:hypothetical protein